jgi:hypothetical protein
MADLPQPWRDYAQAQDTLHRTTKVDDRYWGMEAGLNFIVEEAAKGLVPSGNDLARTVRSEARRERNRVQLRRRHMPYDEPLADPLPVLEARSELRRIRFQVSAGDWALLAAVGVGREYSEIAVLSGRANVAVRVRVMRLRQQVTPKAA